jgi:hypothetical protein
MTIHPRHEAARKRQPAVLVVASELEQPEKRADHHLLYVHFQNPKPK